MKKLMAMAGIMAISAMAQTTDKTGGLAFRFDDNQPLERWQAMSEVFDKYGYPMSLALNMEKDNPFDEPSLAFLHEGLKKGYELMDHTPNHSAFTFLHPQAEKYANEPWVDHINGKKVCLKYIVRNDAPESDARFTFKATINGNTITLPEEVKQKYINGQHAIINGKAYVLRPKSKDNFILESFWREPVDLGELGEVEVEFASKNYGFAVDVRGLKEACKLVRERREKLGFPAATTWIQPGSPEAIIQADNVREAYAPEGYVSAATYQDSAALVFCEPEPMRCAYAMMWGQICLEPKPALDQLKKTVADAVATHRVLIASSHIRTEQFADGIAGFAKLHDELLEWCKAKGIMVKTQSQWARLLYHTKTDPNENILPPLNVDLNEDGIPDGYTLGKSSIYENGTVSVSGKNYLCGIHRLGGVEKGTNKLEFDIQGGAPRVRITFTPNKGQAQSLEFNNAECSFDVPENTVTINIDIWNLSEEKMLLKGGTLHK